MLRRQGRATTCTKSICFLIFNDNVRHMLDINLLYLNKFTTLLSNTESYALGRKLVKGKMGECYIKCLCKDVSMCLTSVHSFKRTLL